MYEDKINQFYDNLEKFEKKQEKSRAKGWEKQLKIASFCVRERERLFLETLSGEQLELYKELDKARRKLDEIFEDKYLNIK